MLQNEAKRPMHRNIIFAAAVAMVMTGNSGVISSAAAQENIIQNLLEGAGLTSSRSKQIEYRERAPLVVPPKVGALPPPQTSAAKANPAWPTDPDAERRRKLEEEEKVPAGQDYKSYLNRNNPWISPDELRNGRRAGTGAVSEPDTTNREGRTVVSPDELRRGNPALKNMKPKDPTVEPTRRRLTDPPTGYRTIVPETSGPQSAAVEPEQKKGFFSHINPFGKN